MAQVSTTGLRASSTDCRNQAVSSSVSVPWVMTTPRTSGSARARIPHSAVPAHATRQNSMSLLSICATCSAPVLPLQRRLQAGNGMRQQLLHAHLCSGVAHVVDMAAALPAIVPPVPSTTIFCRSLASFQKLVKNTVTGLKNSNQPPATHRKRHARQPQAHRPPAADSGPDPARHFRAPVRRPHGPKSPPSWASSPPTPLKSTCRPWPAKASSNWSAAPPAASACAMTPCAPSTRHAAPSSTCPCQGCPSWFCP
jgi:hypothetical protein